MSKRKAGPNWAGGRKPHPQGHMEVEARSKSPGDIRALPYLKKIHIIIPNIIVDQLKRDATDHGFTTLSGLIRHIIAASELTSIADVAQLGAVVWGPEERTQVKNALPTPTPVGKPRPAPPAVPPHTGQRKLIR